MKRDPLRKYIADAEECYELAASPPSNRIWGSPEDVIDPETEPLAEARAKCLRIGIDVKYIVVNFLDGLERDHGSRRAERTKYYLQNGYISSFSPAHREQIKADGRRLFQIIRRYRVDGKDL